MPRTDKSLNLEEIKVSCRDCSLTELCLPHGMNETEIGELDKIVKHLPPQQAGQHLYRAGDKGRSLFAVRSGAAKSYCITGGGDEQVVGFTLPGELVGLDGLSDGFYTSSSLVLETSSICEMPYDGLEGLCKTLPGLNRQILRVAAREISAEQQMLMQLGKRTAEERLASFLLSLSTRFNQRGLRFEGPSARAFRLRGRGGKSGLLGSGWLPTATGREARESATEKIPPVRRPPASVGAASREARQADR